MLGKYHIIEFNTIEHRKQMLYKYNQVREGTKKNLRKYLYKIKQDKYRVSCQQGKHIASLLA